MPPEAPVTSTRLPPPPPVVVRPDPAPPGEDLSCAGRADASRGSGDEHPLAAKPRFHGPEATAVMFTPRAAEEGGVTSKDHLTELEVGLAILDTLDPNDELSREELDLLAWRFEQLLGHGYGVDDALEIARAKHVDLELARSLTEKFGCSPELATRILL